MLAESARPEREHPAQPTLRLVTDSDLVSSGGDLSPSMRLSEFFTRVYLPWMKGRLASNETVLLYQQAVDKWVAITGDPPLYQITDELCSSFVEALASSPGRKNDTLASHTIVKHCNHLQWILNRTGPREPNHPKKRRNKGLLPEIPLIERPLLDIEPPDGDFTIDETLAILASFTSHKPRAPKESITGVPADAWWRALIAVCYYSGLRIGAVMQLEWTFLQGEWLVVPPRVMKRRKGKKQFLSAEAREAIEPLRKGHKLIFAWPNWLEKKGARRSMRRVFELRLIKAGLPEHRQFGFHGFRKAHATEIASVNPLAAQLSLGHSDSKTTTDHYVNPRVAAEAIKRMPSLRAAEKAARAMNQMRLF